MIRPLVPEMTFNHAKIGMPLKGFHRHFLIPSLCIGMGIIGWYMWSLWSLIIALLPILLFLFTLYFIHVLVVLLLANQS